MGQESEGTVARKTLSFEKPVLALTTTDLVDLPSVAIKGQLFQFDGALYGQTDGVAMGSPLSGFY